MLYPPEIREFLRTRRVGLALLALLGCGTLSSCSTTPVSRLHGRWFNSDVSVRFRTDGTVIYNSREGLATGRYFFDGEVRPASSEQPVPNLTMDLQRNGRVFRVHFEVQFLGDNRLRIKPAVTEGELSEEDIRPVVILTRAENEDVNGVASAG